MVVGETKKYLEQAVGDLKRVAKKVEQRNIWHLLLSRHEHETQRIASEAVDMQEYLENQIAEVKHFIESGHEFHANQMNHLQKVLAPQIELEVLSELLDATKQKHKQVFTELRQTVDETIKAHDEASMLPDYVQRLRQF